MKEKVNIAKLLLAKYPNIKEAGVQIYSKLHGAYVEVTDIIDTHVNDPELRHYKIKVMGIDGSSLISDIFMKTVLFATKGNVCYNPQENSPTGISFYFKTLIVRILFSVMVLSVFSKTWP